MYIIVVLHCDWKSYFSVERRMQNFDPSRNICTVLLRKNQKLLSFDHHTSIY